MDSVWVVSQCSKGFYKVSLATGYFSSSCQFSLIRAPTRRRAVEIYKEELALLSQE